MTATVVRSKTVSSAGAVSRGHSSEHLRHACGMLTSHGQQWFVSDPLRRARLLLGSPSPPPRRPPTSRTACCCHPQPVASKNMANWGLDARSRPNRWLHVRFLRRRPAHSFITSTIYDRSHLRCVLSLFNLNGTNESKPGARDLQVPSHYDI
jgi:hypothetical protein